MAKGERKRPRRKKPRKGEMADSNIPVWEPLLGLARVYIDEFMWMFEIELDDGTRLQAYKHYWTRRYLYLDGEGEAWLYCGDAGYEQLNEDIVDHFNRVVLWRHPRQHEEEWEEAMARREELQADAAPEQ